MTLHINKARRAGLLYLLSIVSVGASLLYVQDALIVDGNATLTASHILASKVIFRLCICGEFAGTIVLVVVANFLSRAFGELHEVNSPLLLIFVAILVPLAFVNCMIDIAALELLRDAGFLSAFDAAKRQASSLFLLDLHWIGSNLANMIRGIWLLPFGMLILRTRHLPRFIGIWLLANGAALVLVGLSQLLAPDSFELVFWLSVIPQFGQIVAATWLVSKGLQDRTAAGRA